MRTHPIRREGKTKSILDSGMEQQLPLGVWFSYSEWLSYGCTSCELQVSLFPPLPTPTPTPGFILKMRCSCQDSRDFPAVYYGETKYHVMLENSPVLSSHGLCYLMARMRDPRPGHWLLLLRFVTSSSRQCSHLFVFPASQHAIDKGLLKGRCMFVQYMCTPPSWNTIPKEGIMSPLEQLFYFQGKRGSAVLSSQMIRDIGSLVIFPLCVFCVVTTRAKV